MSTDTQPDTAISAIDDIRSMVARSHGLRTLGLALCVVMVGAVLQRHAAPAPTWVLLALYALVWPHVAWLLVRRSDRPYADERRWCLADAAMAGVWIALMQFNLLPCVLLATMAAITLIAMGGARLLAHGMVALVLACAVAAVANGLEFAPETGSRELLASLPLLVVFPVTLGFIMNSLARRVRSQNRQLLRLSSSDSLSGLLNRRSWELAVGAALARHCCDDAVMLLIDIDTFKRVNDQFGHTVGDEVIRRVGSIIRGTLRQGDLAGRYGGDEFGVVLCGVDMQVAATVAERVRSAVACSLFERALGMRCTLSIGLAGGPTSGGDIRDWIARADAALYRAKLAGRNRFVVAN